MARNLLESLGPVEPLLPGQWVRITAYDPDVDGTDESDCVGSFGCLVRFDEHDSRLPYYVVLIAPPIGKECRLITPHIPDTDWVCRVKPVTDEDVDTAIMAAMMASFSYVEKAEVLKWLSHYED